MTVYPSMADLKPKIALGDHIKSQIAECQHQSKGLFAKTASNGALMYMVCCMTCGATIPQPKGATSHKAIAKRFDISAIPDKSAADEIARGYQDWRRYQQQILFASYEAHLESAEWAELRQQVISRDGSCVCCGGAIDEVHHVTYERLYRESLDDLVGVCSPCHKAIHHASA